LIAPVDLLWNGGIGTLRQGVDRAHRDAGDKANERGGAPTAPNCGPKVVGEGGKPRPDQLGASNSPGPADASKTPTRSTIPRVSTSPTTRST